MALRLHAHRGLDGYAKPRLAQAQRLRRRRAASGDRGRVPPGEALRQGAGAHQGSQRREPAGA